MRIRDTIDPTTVTRLAATLNLPASLAQPGAVLPLGWHGVFCLPAPATAELSPDGLGPPGDFMPAVPLPRRMFGGARITVHAPLRVGDAVECVSEVVETKERGAMIIVVLRHSYSAAGTLCVEEEQDLVHLPVAEGGPPPGKPAPLEAALQERIEPNPELLFRFSALTFNSHRIHYDATYARETEHLPALLVQGKLAAFVTMGLLSKNGYGERVRRFAYRAVRPLYADRPFLTAAAAPAAGGTTALWCADADGFLALSATAELA